jgi:hypothetical protein
MPRKFWIKKAISPGRKGALRARLREVGAMPKKAERIPREALEKAARGAWGPTTARRARLAITLRRFH